MRRRQRQSRRRRKGGVPAPPSGGKIVSRREPKAKDNVSHEICSGWCCAAGSFFVLFSPVTVIDSLGRGRGSVLSLRARARASNQHSFTRIAFPPGSEDDEENHSPERLASSSATASSWRLLPLFFRSVSSFVPFRRGSSFSAGGRPRGGAKSPLPRHHGGAPFIFFFSFAKRHVRGLAPSWSLPRWPA